MSILGVALVLTAAFCHATWNFYVKRINGGPELIWLFSAVSVVIYLPVAVWVLLSQNTEFGPWSVLFIFGTTVLHLGYFLLLQLGYRKGDLSFVYPIARSSGPVLSTSFAVLLLGESITIQMAIGAGIIILGIFMLTGGIRFGRENALTSLVFGLMVGTLIGCYTAWDAYAVSVLLISPVLLDYAANMGRAVVLTPVAIKNRTRIAELWRDHRFGVCVIAVLSPLAYILVLYAMTFTPVAYVAPLREVSVLLSVLAGSILLKEGHLKHRLQWAAVIMVGMVVLISG